VRHIGYACRRLWFFTSDGSEHKRRPAAVATIGASMGGGGHREAILGGQNSEFEKGGDFG